MTGAHDDADERIMKVLGKYVPERSARALVLEARRSTGTDGIDLETANISAFLVALEQHAARYLDRRARAQLHGELEFELATARSSILPVAPVADETVDVRSEWDVSLARARAREIMSALGAKSYDVVKTMTLVSELARNIVLYTPGGQVCFTLNENPRGLVVRVTDEGPGIPHLDEVLSGRYRSKTGLGKGLLGVQRLATRFFVQTNPTGTHVEVEVRF